MAYDQKSLPRDDRMCTDEIYIKQRRLLTQPLYHVTSIIVFLFCIDSIEDLTMHIMVYLLYYV